MATSKHSLIDPAKAYEYVCRVEEHKRRETSELSDLMPEKEAGGERKPEDLSPDEKWQKVIGKPTVFTV